MSISLTRRLMIAVSCLETYCETSRDVVLRSLVKTTQIRLELILADHLQKNGSRGPRKRAEGKRIYLRGTTLPPYKK